MLKERGIDAVSFAYPYGLMNPFFSGMVEEYYQNAAKYPLIISGSLNFKDTNIWKIESVVPRSASEFSGLLRRAVEKKAWMVACFHGIRDDENRYTISMKEFTAMVDFAVEMRKKQLVDIITVSEGAEKLRRK